MPALATTVDGVVLVLYAGISRRTAASRAAEQIRKVGGRLLGVVLVDVRPEEEFDRDDAASRPLDLVGQAWDRVVDGLRR